MLVGDLRSVTNFLLHLATVPRSVRVVRSTYRWSQRDIASVVRQMEICCCGAAPWRTIGFAFRDRIRGFTKTLGFIKTMVFKKIGVLQKPSVLKKTLVL